MITERQDKFDPEVLRGILANYIATSDKSFLDLENPWLQKAFQYTNPQSLLALKAANTVKADIKKNYEGHKTDQIRLLKVNILMITLECYWKNKLDH
jgi:hypothetical protein